MERGELVQYFDERLFIPKMAAKSKEKCLEELIDRFVEIKLIKKREIVLKMLQERESLGSTGIGKGVAIPHGRSTAASDVMVAFGKSVEGIDFDSMDGKPVHLIFMVLAPPQEENNRYLPLLGKLVEILREDKNRKGLMEVESFQEFVNLLKGEEDVK